MIRMKKIFIYFLMKILYKHKEATIQIYNKNKIKFTIKMNMILLVTNNSKKCFLTKEKTKEYKDTIK